MPRPTKKAAPLHIVRRWVSSPILFGRDSREMQDNPDFHPAVSLTSDGRFLSDAGTVLAEKDLPEYIRREAKTTDRNIEYVPPKKRDLSLGDAMIGAGVQDTEPDPTVRAGRNRRAAQAFA